MKSILVLLFFLVVYSNFYSQNNCESARKAYLELNNDVKKAGLDPWFHYQNYGYKEGRKWPECNSNFSKIQINQSSSLISKDLVSGKILKEGLPYTGTIFGEYNNGQIKEKYNVVDGIASGVYESYYYDQNYSRIQYFDSSRINKAQFLIESDKIKLSKLSNDSIGSFNKQNDYFNTNIGSQEKYQKLWDKNRNKKLKGKKKQIFDEYSILLSEHKTIKSSITETKNNILMLEKEQVNERNKPVYLPKIEFSYNQLNLIKEGTYRSFYKNGNPSEYGTYSNNLKIGEWITYHDNGKEKSKGNYTKNELKNGEWNYYQSNGSITLTELYELDGKTKSKRIYSYYDNGKIKEYYEVANSGVKEGLYTEFYTTGEKKAFGTYKNNLQNGSWSFYFENGNLKAQGSYINGNGNDTGDTGVPKNNRDGIWKTYTDDGKLSQEQSWVKNQMVYLKAYYPSGNVQLKREYSNYKKNNYVETKYFDEVGITEAFGTFVNGKLHGLSKMYYQNGQLKTYLMMDTNAVNTSYTTEFKEFNESGTLVTHVVAQNGVFVDKLVSNTQNSNPSSNVQVASTKELNKPYKCKCCKATINGITDGLSESGGEYSDWHFNYYSKVYGTPEMKNLMKTMSQESEKLYLKTNGWIGEKNASSKEFSVYDVLRGEFEYCSLKCSKLCKDE